VFAKDKAKIASGVGCSERGVVYFRVVVMSDTKKFNLRRAKNKKEAGK